MSVNQEVIDKNLLKLTYAADADKVEEGLAYSFNKNKKNFNIKGFRAGKAPRKVVEQYYGVEVLFADAEEYVVTDMYYASVAELGIEPVSYPQNVQITKMSKEGMEFSLEVYTKPVAEVKDYKGVEITEISAEVGDEDIERALQMEAEKNSRMVTVEDRPAQLGDTVDIDFEGFVDDVPFDGGKGEGHKLQLGSGQFIPGFEDQLVGVNTGDDVTVNVKFPEDYHAEDLKGKDSVFKVKVNAIQTKELPEINDDFASDVSSFDTLDEYKADIKEKLAKEKADAAKDGMMSEALKKVIDATEIDIPAPMVDREVEDELNRMGQRVQAYGMTVEQYCMYMGTTIEEFREKSRPQAELNIKRDLILEAIVKAEEITVSAEELDKEFEIAAEYMKKPVEEIKTQYAANIPAIEEEVKRRKAAELILEAAVKVPAKAEEAAPAPKKKAPAKRKAPAKKAAEPKVEESKTEENA